MRVSAAPGGSYGMALRLSGGVGLRASLEGLRHPLPIKVDFSAHSCYRTAWEYLAKPSGGKPLEKIDTMPYQTPNHPAEADIPRADPRLQGMWRARTRQAQGASARATRMTAKELYSLVKDPEAEMKLRWKGWDGWGVRRTWKERKVERRTDCPCEGTVPPTPLNN